MKSPTPALNFRYAAGGDAKQTVAKTKTTTTKNAKNGDVL